jgi:glycosyltransferase involved in cell wall biosynthesis
MDKPTKNVAISVVVPCRNERSHIESCLESILHQEEPDGGFEVIVVDALSDDGTRELLEDFARAEPRLRIINNPAQVTPCAFNLGIAHARGGFIAIMGAHNSYGPDYLRQCLAIARETGADNVGGSMMAVGSSPIQTAIALAHHSRFSCGGARWHNIAYEGEVDTLFGGFYRREVFARLGGFDESLVRNQDDEFNLRLRRSGGRIWHSPLIRSWYHPRADLAALFGQYIQYGYWKVRVIQKHRLPASWRHLIPGLFVLALITLPVIGLLLWRPFLWLWFGMIALYAGTVVAVSLAVARRHGWRYLAFLPSIFPAYHIGYGWGFLLGIIDFFLLRRAPGVRLTNLTRGLQIRS